MIEQAMTDATVKLWLAWSALAGSLTSIGLLKPLTWFGRLTTIFVGMMTYFFVSPAIVEHFLADEKASSNIVAFIYYITSLLSMAVFPPFLKWAGEKAGDPLNFFKSTKEDKK